MTTPLTRLSGAVADRYRLERELGAGGMATVYLAEDLKHRRKVALKVLKPELAAVLGAERFLHEIRITAKLQHPHILPLFDSGEAAGFVYYVMPSVEGESLRARLAREKQLPLDEVIRVAGEVAEALDYAHRQGVIHRDIKPENILLHEGKALVADFGIALAVSAAGGSRLTETGLSLGTPQYMSPEQATGDRVLDARSDVYSLGAVVYEMLAGEAPHTGATAQAVLAKVIADRPRPLRQVRGRVPVGVEEAVNRALAATPADRFPNAGGFVAALRPPTPSAIPTGSRPLLLGGAALIALLVVAVVALAVFRGDGGRNAADPTTPIEAREQRAAKSENQRFIAVLPFTNLSADPENEFFSDGITDDIITQLSKVSAFKVISRTSSMRYKNTDKSMRQIAGELGVSALVQGNVRRAGQRLKISAELINPETGLNLWAETYDRELRDVFAIQSEVALRVAAALQTVLTAAERARMIRRATESIEAYDLYVLGRYEANKRNEEGLERAIQYFQQAVDRDPRYAAAYAGLADAYTLSAIGYRAIPPLDALARAKAAAQKALAIDESEPDAHASLGFVYTNEWDWPNARREFERAIELNPSLAKAHQWYGQHYISVRDFDAALAEATRALELDPLSVVLTNELGWPYLFRGDHLRAREQHLRALAMDSSFAMAHYNLAWTYEREGRYDQAIPIYEHAVALSGGLGVIRAALAAAYARAGQPDRARAIRDQLVESASASGFPIWMAYVCEALGETDAALDWLEKAFKARSPFLPSIGTPPFPFSRIRDHPRFTALLAKLGVPR